jgi:CDP-glucose 4,6-dehydratase
MTNPPAPSPLPAAGFWRGKRVLVTGHTGFKGAWLTLWLNAMGARVTGFSRAPDQSPSLFDLARIDRHCTSVIGELTDGEALARAVKTCNPEIVLHLAAQALVRRSLARPVETVASNVLGTASLLDALRQAPALQAILVVTSDKVYDHSGHVKAFSESDRLGGKDPYSASKAACEIIVASFAASFFPRLPVATVRGGNVIGGGDFSEDRLVPDIVRSAISGTPLVLRHPDATRPWQHVLDCLCGYLRYAEGLASGHDLPRTLNIGPDHRSEASVGEVATLLLGALGADTPWQHVPVAGSIEMKTLAINSALARSLLPWADRLSGRASLDWTAGWYGDWRAGADAQALTLGQIARYTHPA